MSNSTPTREQKLAKCEALAGELAALQDAVSDKQKELYAAVQDVFPENHGGQPERGLVSTVARRIDWTREYVAKIRDGKHGPKTTG